MTNQQAEAHAAELKELREQCDQLRAELAHLRQHGVVTRREFLKLPMETRREIMSAQTDALLAAPVEKHDWPDCGEVQCDRGHEVYRILFPLLDVECPDNIYIIGKTIRICEAIQGLKNRLVIAEAACKAFVHWYDEDSTEHNRDIAYFAAKEAIAHAKAS